MIASGMASVRPNCGVDIITCVNIYKELPSV